MFRAYKYRLLPTDNQKEILDSYFSATRLIYNLALETKIYAWQSARINLSAFDLNRQLPDLKKEFSWLCEIPAQTLESSITNMDKAFKAFYSGGNFPKFKRKSSKQSYHARQDVRVVGNKIQLPKIGRLDFIQHRSLCEGKIKTCTVSKTTTGKYFISILVGNGADLPKPKPVQNLSTIGIDMGVKTFAVLSDGGEVENPKHLDKMLSRLRIEKRTLARRFKRGAKEQSRNYNKQKLVVATLYEKITNRRNDFLHKASTAIIKQYDTICLEDLNVSGMMQNRKLSKAVADASWYAFSSMLEYKAKWQGKNIVYINRFAPSSKTCSSCETINKELKLSDRVWTCENCGSTHDRDLNAAINIKNFGLRSQPLTANVSH